MDPEKPNLRDTRTELRFFVDNIIIDEYGPLLGPYGLAVYNVICRHSSKDGTGAFPAYQTIARKAGCGVRKAQEMVQLLGQLHLIAIIHRRVGQTQEYTSNEYWLLDPDPVPVQREVPLKYDSLEDAQRDARMRSTTTGSAPHAPPPQEAVGSAPGALGSAPHAPPQGAAGSAPGAPGGAPHAKDQSTEINPPPLINPQKEGVDQKMSPQPFEELPSTVLPMSLLARDGRTFWFVRARLCEVLEVPLRSYAWHVWDDQKSYLGNWKTKTAMMTYLTTPDEDQSLGVATDAQGAGEDQGLGEDDAEFLGKSRIEGESRLDEMTPEERAEVAAPGASAEVRPKDRGAPEWQNVWRRGVRMSFEKGFTMDDVISFVEHMTGPQNGDLTVPTTIPTARDWAKAARDLLYHFYDDLMQHGQPLRTDRCLRRLKWAVGYFYWKRDNRPDLFTFDTSRPGSFSKSIAQLSKELREIQKFHNCSLDELPNERQIEQYLSLHPPDKGQRQTNTERTLASARQALAPKEEREVPHEQTQRQPAVVDA